MGIITAKNLNLWYTTNHALKDINIELPERQITALIGPSGSSMLISFNAWFAVYHKLRFLAVIIPIIFLLSSSAF